MQVREVTIKNFRGIRSFGWRPTSSLSCIVGAGDSCKSTILDALEMTLGTRWLAVTDVDFTDGDTTQSIEIVATLGQLPPEALRENRMGMHLRGWRLEGGVRDEPEGDDEPVVSVRLTVDSSLEPAWELITDRQDPRSLSPRDRAIFGLVRLGGDAERHLTWGQGSALARLSTDKDQAAPLLADAYRKARDLLKAGTLPTLDAVATRVRAEAIKLGAYTASTASTYAAGLDTQRSSMSLGTLAMHGDGVPLRLAGLGTRRLVALAVQQMSIPEGAVVLIDEFEHGLEPHRIRHTLKVLRDALSAGDGAGQVIVTAHSATTVVELSCDQLSVCHRAGGQIELKSPTPRLQAMVRRVPEAFLSRRVLVCEGKTEVGVLRGLRDFWAGRHEDEPPEARGIIAADGNGKEAVATACDLARLGYAVALLRDSDVPLTADESKQLKELSIEVFEWEGALSTEERILLDISTDAVQQLLSMGFEYFGEDSVLDSVRAVLGTKEKLAVDYSSWQIQGRGDAEFRKAVGLAAKKKEWFKLVDRGERLGLLLAGELEKNEGTPTGTTLAATEAWAYGR
jgi:hypothetical protein